MSYQAELRYDLIGSKAPYAAISKGLIGNNSLVQIVHHSLEPSLKVFREIVLWFQEKQ